MIEILTLRERRIQSTADTLDRVGNVLGNSGISCMAAGTLASINDVAGKQLVSNSALSVLAGGSIVQAPFGMLKYGLSKHGLRADIKKAKDGGHRERYQLARHCFDEFINTPISALSMFAAIAPQNLGGVSQALGKTGITHIARAADGIDGALGIVDTILDITKTKKGERDGKKSPCGPSVSPGESPRSLRTFYPTSYPSDSQRWPPWSLVYSDSSSSASDSSLPIRRIRL